MEINKYDNYIYRKKDLIKIITEGGEKQLDIVQEECSELIQAISKWKRYKNTDAKLKVIEEAADVQIMLNQLRIMFSITEEILNDEMDCKIDRQIQRIEDDRAI